VNFVSVGTSTPCITHVTWMCFRPRASLRLTSPRPACCHRSRLGMEAKMADCIRWK
jgi:hypothetical protein